LKNRMSAVFENQKGTKSVAKFTAKGVGGEGEILGGQNSHMTIRKKGAGGRGTEVSVEKGYQAVV